MGSLCNSSMVLYHDLETDRPHRYWAMAPGGTHEFVMDEFLAELEKNVPLPRPYKFPAKDISDLVVKMSLVAPGGVFPLGKILAYMNAC